MARRPDRAGARSAGPLHWSIAALVALAVFVPSANAGTTAPTDAHMSQRFTAPIPGARTGWAIDVALRPPFAAPQRRVDIVLPRGTRLDAGAVRTCQASDLALLVDGGRACPRRARVGSGSAALSVGPGMTTTVPVRAFAAPGALVLLYGADRAVVNLARGRVTGDRIAFAAPVMRQLSGLKPSIVRLRLTLAAAGTGARPMIRAPRTCPPGGRWTFAYLSRYDRPLGLQRSSSSTPCRSAQGS